MSSSLKPSHVEGSSLHKLWRCITVTDELLVRVKACLFGNCVVHYMFSCTDKSSTHSHHTFNILSTINSQQSPLSNQLSTVTSQQSTLNSHLSTINSQQSIRNNSHKIFSPNYSEHFKNVDFVRTHVNRTCIVV